MNKTAPTDEVRYGIHSSPFGFFVVGTLSGSVCLLSFLEGRSDALANKAIRRDWPMARLVRDDRGTAAIAAAAFSSVRTRPQLRCILAGTDFQIKVWTALAKIPKGKTASYQEIAARIGSPRSARAVGSACGKNSIGLLIPCHRVLASTGELGGYRWGTKRKEAILAWES